MALPVPKSMAPKREYVLLRVIIGRVRPRGRFVTTLMMPPMFEPQTEDEPPLTTSTWLIISWG